MIHDLEPDARGDALHHAEAPPNKNAQASSRVTPRVIPIRIKLLSATLVSGLLAMLIVVAGLYCMLLLNQRLEEVVKVASEKVRLTHLLQQDLSSALQLERAMLLATNKKEFGPLSRATKTTLQSIDNHVGQLRKVFEPKNQIQLDQFIESFEKWKQNHYEFRENTGLDAQYQARELSLGLGESCINEFELTINGMISTIAAQAETRQQAARDSQAKTGANALPKPETKETNSATMAPSLPKAATAETERSKTENRQNENPNTANADAPKIANKPARKTVAEATKTTPTPQRSSATVALKPATGETDDIHHLISFADETRAKLRLLTTLRSHAFKLQRAEKNLILQASDGVEVATQQTIDPLSESIASQITILKNRLNEKELSTFSMAETQLQKFIANNQNVLEALQTTANNFKHIAARGKRPKLVTSCSNLANQMINHSERAMENYEKESKSQYQFFRVWLLALSAIAVGTSLVISLWIGNGVATNVRKLHTYAKQIHLAKDLTRPVPDVSNDEIGELAVAFDEMRVSLLQQNSQLATLNETLEQKNEEMEQFVYSASHDLKSPLVSCKGLVGLINEDIADGEFEEVVHSANRLAGVTDKMSNTIDDLLTFSRLGRDRLPLQPIDMNALIEQLREEWEDRFEDSGVTLRVDKYLPTIQADPIAVRRVFDNLIGNAVKYAGDVPDATIEIGSRRTGSKIEFFVRDNGPGIEPQYHDKIFGLFQRLDTSKTGTGIGLASVAKIMRQHRGRIWVDSRLNEGATFWVKFPVPTAEPSDSI